MLFEYATILGHAISDETNFDKISLIVTKDAFVSAEYDTDKYDELNGAIVSYVYLNQFHYMFSKSDYKAILTWLTDDDLSVEFVVEFEKNNINNKWLDINVVKYDSSGRKYEFVHAIRKSRKLATGERECFIVKNRKAGKA